MWIVMTVGTGLKFIAWNVVWYHWKVKHIDKNESFVMLDITPIKTGKNAEGLESWDKCRTAGLKDYAEGYVVILNQHIRKKRFALRSW